MGVQLCPGYSARVSQQVKAQMHGAGAVLGALGNPALPPRDVAQEQGGLKASSSFCPKKRGGEASWRSRGAICCVSHLGAHRARQGELSGLRTSAVTPQWVLVLAQGGG